MPDVRSELLHLFLEMIGQLATYDVLSHVVIHSVQMALDISRSLGVLQRGQQCVCLCDKFLRKESSISIRSIATHFCILYSRIDWLGPLPEDLLATPHHTSFQALVDSGNECSRETGKRCRRLQVIKTARDTNSGGNATRLAA